MTERIRGLELENEAQRAKLQAALRAPPDPEVQAAVHTDRLARELHAAREQVHALEQELADCTDSWQVQEQGFRSQVEHQRQELAQLRAEAQASKEQFERMAEAARRAQANASQAEEERHRCAELMKDADAKRAVALRELDAMAYALTTAEAELERTIAEKEEVDRSLGEQLLAKDQRAEQLQAENDELRLRVQLLEEAAATAAAAAVGVSTAFPSASSSPS